MQKVNKLNFVQKNKMFRNPIYKTKELPHELCHITTKASNLIILMSELGDLKDYLKYLDSKIKVRNHKRR